MMKKFKFLILPVTAAAVTLSACGGEPVNQGPELRGVSDFTCLVNTYVDLLDGVAALDEEDGDITPQLEINITPAAEVKDGYALFTEAGDYEICYEVRDGMGKLARTTAFATVIERDVYRSDICTNGFTVTAGGGAAIEADGLNGGVYSFKASGQEIAEDIKLAKMYTMVCGVEYTYKYYLNCNIAGRIKAAADGEQIAELNVAQGENVLQFKHALPFKQSPEGGAASDSVNIELWLGSLEGGLECSLSKAELNYYREDDGFTENLPDFNFNGKTDNRFDDDNGRLVLNGSSEIADGGRGVKLKISETNAPDIWRGGVFVNTGLPLNAGECYYVSFDLQSENQNPYEVLLLCKQWGPGEWIATVNGADGRQEKQIDINDGNKGSLWLYIQSGNAVNEITLSNLSVKTKSGGEKSEIYSIGNFTTNNFNGGIGTVKTEYGKAVYEIENFGYDWGNNELGSPEFNLSGAADNYVITFKAKASAELNCVFAATVAANWDTFAWENFKMSAGEKTYSIRCNEKNLDGVYKFVWQFGNVANADLHGVTVEISDIKICLKSELEN